MLPAMYLVPRLYGKIEPLLGVKPRDKETQLEGGVFTPKNIALILAGVAAAIGAELLASGGYELIDWEADWAESSTALATGLVVAAAVAVIAVLVMRRNASDPAAKKN